MIGVWWGWIWSAGAESRRDGDTALGDGWVGEAERWFRAKAVSPFVPHSATAVQKGKPPKQRGCSERDEVGVVGLADGIRRHGWRMDLRRRGVSFELEGFALTGGGGGLNSFSERWT